MASESTRTEIINFLVSRKFPALKTIKAASANPNIIAPSGEQIAELVAGADGYRSELQAMASDALQSLHEAERSAVQTEWNEKLRREEQRRFFNHHSAKADIDHWSRAAHWTIDEAIALCMDKAPEIVNPKSLRPLAEVSKFAAQYFRLQDLANRAVKWNKLFDPVLPGIFLAWAKQNEIEYPIELERLVIARGQTVGNWKSAYDTLQLNFEKLQAVYKQVSASQTKSIDELAAALNEVVSQRDTAWEKIKEFEQQSSGSTPQPIAQDLKPTTSRERNNMLRIIVAMAVKHYRYDPRKPKNSATQNIVTALDELGLKLSEESVLKYLRESADLVDWVILDETRKP